MVNLGNAKSNPFCKAPLFSSAVYRARSFFFAIHRSRTDSGNRHSVQCRSHREIFARDIGLPGCRMTWWWWGGGRNKKPIIAYCGGRLLAILSQCVRAHVCVYHVYRGLPDERARIPAGYPVTTASCSNGDVVMGWQRRRRRWRGGSPTRPLRLE